MSAIVSHWLLNISETVRDSGLVPKDHQNTKSPMGYQMVTWTMTSRDLEKTRYTNTLRAQYLENSWRCYLATIANY